MDDFRTEVDSMGEIQVPSAALYGAQTQRALDNFPVSGLRLPPLFIKALALIKGCAAASNAQLGLLDHNIAEAITSAVDEIVEGKWDEHFPIDIFQTGSGTSTNMNANEVISNRASQILGLHAGSKKIHPNDHVNLCQSSNDVIPSAIHVGALIGIKEDLVPGLSRLRSELLTRGVECKDIIKTGRTHLMDALPVLLSQELEGWAYQISQCIERIESCLPRISKIAVGGTAVGTGVNAHPDFAGTTIRKLNKKTGLSFSEADNHFAAQASMDNIAELSGHLKATAVALMKISNDLRLMNSGPGAGLAEISLPALQPGSSIMPGKVNPVICESVMMACAQVIGNDAAITVAANMGTFELNTGLPLIAYNILQSIGILANSAAMLAEKAISGFVVNERHISELLGRNPILMTVLAPKIGYDKAARIVKKAFDEKRPIIQIAREELDMPEEELARMLDPKKMVEKGIR